MSIDEKTTMPTEKSDAIAPAAQNPSQEYEVGEVSKVDIKAADPAFALVFGERVEYTEEEGKSVLSKIVSIH